MTHFSHAAECSKWYRAVISSIRMTSCDLLTHTVTLLYTFNLLKKLHVVTLRETGPGFQRYAISGPV